MDRTKANHQVTVLFQKQLLLQAKRQLLKIKYAISSDSSLHHLSSKMENKIQGIDMELIKAIAKDQGFTIEIDNPGFDAAVSDVHLVMRKE